ncbi:MAG: response regulator [Magnetospirillum sp.]|nr:response regulator [Magnetospirillum sp.]
MPTYTDKRALVIDDQEFVRRAVATMLDRMGFAEIRQAADGAGGLEACGRAWPDLVICDVEMEPIDGLVFLKAFRGEAVRMNRPSPVIFLSSHSEAETVRQARRLGVDAFLLKPVTGAELKRRVDFVLDAPRCPTGAGTA